MVGAMQTYDGQTSAGSGAHRVEPAELTRQIGRKSTLNVNFPLEQLCAPLDSLHKTTSLV
jgi:hypothetical protein